jgi:glutaminyl-peptide cyclotransferase
MRFYLIILFFGLVLSCRTESSNTNKPNVSPSPKSSPTVSIYGYEVVNTYKHDPKAFTQGLVIFNNFLYESTGLEGRSSLRKVELETGKVVQKVDLPSEIFAEGITILNDKIYQISWKNGLAWEYDLESFTKLNEFHYSGEGWGLTNNGTNLIMSDGTHVIRFVDPKNFETVKTITVFRENGQPLMSINELEWVKGEIWANVWQDPMVARIDPESGKLKGWIDLSPMVKEEMRSDSEDVLNGIAYDEKTDRIFVTGKLWKKLFEIKLKAKS